MTKTGNGFELVVGMEIHVELKTKSKMFCGCKNDPFRAPKPNIYTCPVCLGMPGGLPVPNKKAVEWTIMLGLALGCRINKLSKFDRKNYFYPDLPKGYQISQYDQPFCTDGSVMTPEGPVGITRVHLEEDTGKLLHTDIDGKRVTLIDYNRSGVPLVEIVTEPDIRSAEQARSFLKKLHQIIQYLDISEADMEKGTMRLEPNISLRTAGSDKLPGYKVEVKNINSFSFVVKAIEYESARQVKILKQGGIPDQETRGFIESQGVTKTQRRKETADDYRYFPEPDIPPFFLDDEFVSSVRAMIPEMPDEKLTRFVSQYGLTEYDARILTETRAKADFFEKAVAIGGVSSKAIANRMINRKIDVLGTQPAEFVNALRKESQKTAVPTETYEAVITEVINSNPKAVEDYRAGKQTALMFLLGQARRKNGSLDPREVIAGLKKKLG